MSYEPIESELKMNVPAFGDHDGSKSEETFVVNRDETPSSVLA